MLQLYAIRQDILDCIDMETGEMLDAERLQELQMEKSVKVRNIACWIKNLLAEAQAYESEEKMFAQRKTAAKNKAESLKHYLATCLDGERFKEKEFTISWRKSQQVDIAEGADVPQAYLVPVAPKVDKLGLRDALKKGAHFPGISLVEKNNIQVK